MTTTGYCNAAITATGNLGNVNFKRAIAQSEICNIFLYVLGMFYCAYRCRGVAYICSKTLILMFLVFDTGEIGTAFWLMTFSTDDLNSGSMPRTLQALPTCLDLDIPVPCSDFHIVMVTYSDRCYRDSTPNNAFRLLISTSPGSA
jgi:hypothetical protein